MERLQKVLNHFHSASTPITPINMHSDHNIPSIMKGLYKSKPTKGYEYRINLATPSPKSDEILVKSMAVAICGSDAKLYNWYHITDEVAKVPFIPGHEVSGLVVGIGSNVTNFKIGDRIAVEPHLFCDNVTDCFQCKINRKDICPSMGNFGFGLGTKCGGCSEYFVVKTRNCYKLTQPYISWKNAALLEPVGVACNAIDRLDVDINETVLVTGCGPIGCFVISILKQHYGYKKVFALDLFDSKLEIAKKMGADYVFNGKTDGDFMEYTQKMTNKTGYGQIVECTGNVKVIESLFKIIRKGGNIVLVGVPLETIKIKNAINDWVLNSIQIRSIHGRRLFKNMIDAENFIRDGKIDTNEIVTHFIPLSNFEKGYHDWFNGKACKVVFDVTK